MAQAIGALQNGIGIALITAGCALAIGLIFWVNASRIRKSDARRKEAEDKLVKAAVEWERTFNAIADPIFIVDAENTITRGNTALFNMLKLGPNDVIGKKCYNIMHGSDKPWLSCPMESTVADKAPHTVEVNDPHIGVPLLVSTSPIFDDAGNFVGVVHVSKDISEAKKTEAQLKDRLDALEKFQKITVGRELKMVELKARIAELETKLAPKR